MSKKRAAADARGAGVATRRYFVAWFATAVASDLSEDGRMLSDLTEEWAVRPAWVDLAQASGLDADIHLSRAEELQSMLD